MIPDSTSCTSLPAADWQVVSGLENIVSVTSDLWYTDGMDLSADGYNTQITVTETNELLWDDAFTRNWSLTGGDGEVTFAGGSSTYTTAGGYLGQEVTLYATGASPASSYLGVTLKVTQNTIITAQANFDVRAPQPTASR